MDETLQLDVIHIGDVLKVLKKIPSKSCRCCVTSPPYWGLRDYNTAIWVGGTNTDCNHSRASNIVSDATRSTTLSGGMKNQIESHKGRKQNKNTCSKCGAIRVDNQIGLEESPEEYIKKMVSVFREIYRILTDDGTLWLNIGDSYWGGKGASGDALPDLQMERKKNGKTFSHPQQSIGEKGITSPLQGKHEIIKPKDLVGIPWMLAFALRQEGWYLRQDIIWNKTTCMPESVQDRCTKSHEYIFLLTKNKKYYFDSVAIRQPLAGSTLNDKRLYDENYSTGRLERNLPGKRPDQGNGLLKRKSGNIERKAASMRGVPEGTGKNQSGSVPWEGDSANKRGVWNIQEEDSVWKWMFDNLPEDKAAELYQKYIDEKRNANDLWLITPAVFKGAHFATFPQEIPEQCIRAGTSEHGQCSSCGRPWRRITEKQLLPAYASTPSKNTLPDHLDDLADVNDQGSNRVKDGHKPGYFSSYTTTGWQPTCECNGHFEKRYTQGRDVYNYEDLIQEGEVPDGEDIYESDSIIACELNIITVYVPHIPLEQHPVKPDVVIDPFAGAGTTLVVAGKLHRRWIGVEINPKYVTGISIPRLQSELGMFYSPVQSTLK